MNQIKLLLRRTLSLGLLLFLLGFFFSPTPGNHEHIFLYFIIIPFLLLLLTAYSELAPCLNDRLFIATEAVLLYLALTILWGEGHQALDFFGQLRKVLSITILLLTVRIALQQYPWLQGKMLMFVALSACIAGGLALAKYLPANLETPTRFWPELGSILGLGRYDNPIRVGWTWGATSLCTIWLFYSQRGRNYLWLFLVLPPQLALLAVTFSRGPILAFLVGLPLVLFLKRQAVLEKRNLIAVICFIAVTLGSTMATDLDQKLYAGLSRGTSDFSQDKAQGYSYRIPIWLEAIKQTSHHLVFGQGYTKDKKIILSGQLSFRHSHNFMIDVYRFGGLFGVVLVTLHLLYCLYLSFWQSPHEHKIWGVLLCYGILCLLTNGRYVLNNLSDFWFIYWLPISFIYALRYICLQASQGHPLAQAPNRP